MPVERRGLVTRVEIGLVNWQQEEPADFDRKGGTSRISREAYVRFCEGLGVKLPGPTRRVETESKASYSDTGNRKGRTQLRLRLNSTAPLLDSTFA